MRDVNKVILVGRLGSDPIQTETKNGYQVVNFSMATCRRYHAEGDAEGVFTEDTTWHKIVSWGKQAEACAQYLKKGQQVYVEGSFRSRKYTGKDGTEKVAYEVHTDSVSFLGGSKRAPQEVTEAIQH